jgi:hypothetical protein
MKPQLYMWSPIREHILNRHDFFISQVRTRVFSQFLDIEGEAESHANAEYERLGSLPYREDIEMADVAEWATNRGHERYALLRDLKKQMILGALAGIYHQWDKDLREFIERELRHNYNADFVLKTAWNEDVFDILKEFGWDCRSSNFFKEIDACRLIVNVYKHGKGRSLDDLAKLYPTFLKNIMDEFGGIWATANRAPDHEWLEISDAQFENLAAALRKFWVEFPERLFLQSTNVEPSSASS